MQMHPPSVHLRSITQFLSGQVAKIHHRQWKLGGTTSSRTSKHVICFPEFNEAGAILRKSDHIPSACDPKSAHPTQRQRGSSKSGHPFTSDASALNKGKIASTRSAYIIEPTKIRQLHQFWCSVENEVMKRYPFDEETFSTLPDKDTSPDVYLVDQEELWKLPDNDMGNKNLSHTKTSVSGGDSLLRSAEEERESLMISCTITVREKDDENQNRNLANHLSPTANASFQPSTNTFVVRPAQQFVSDSDPNYLETR
ncbi:hypothetical protein DAPPUDRAFT_106116 [Daphnia pulex]|uniref:Uncharacterized protein n=1 Tax=Daphnia pulex TaxID=6669 RepID=E9GST3_DAPPU|nr:hypothetical protein DAPPUDRAFT_106116 [Daphnia pulex]|eukprot:EFX77486.1 hypothetical protein DAPPUDRAFT_106116 [Daphnia pulex]